MSSLQFIKNGVLHHDELNGDNDLHIFDTPLTDIYLDKYNELIHEHVTFHDIVSLTLFKNNDDITILPNNLKYLYIKSATLTSLPISDNVSSNIEVIFLDFTNINEFPDISRCTKLREITINHSNLQRLRFNYSLPPSLQILNLRYNTISDIDFTLFETNPTLKINLSYNKLNDQDIDTILDINSKVNIKMQNRYTFIPVTHNNYNNIDFQNMMINMIPDANLYNRTTYNNSTHTINVLAGNGQSVHLSSINISIVKSYKNILNHIDTYNLKVSTDYVSLIDEINQEFYKLCFNKRWESCDKSLVSYVAYVLNIDGYFSENTCEYNSFKLKNIKSFLIEKQTDKSIHSILNIAYTQLLSVIWTVVNNHEQRENLIERLYSEIDDSFEKCFTGCMNRLINVLVGYIDGVVVSISLKEEIQMSVQKIMEQFNKKQLDYRQTKEEVVKLLNQDYNVDYSDLNNTISDDYKESWLSALRDYKPDAILCKFYEQVKINDRPDRLYGYYYISYDDLIYNSEQDFDQEKNPVGEISNKDTSIAKIFAYKIESLTEHIISYPEKYLNYRLV